MSTNRERQSTQKTITSKEVQWTKQTDDSRKHPQYHIESTLKQLTVLSSIKEP